MELAAVMHPHRFRELKAPSPVDYVLLGTVLLLVGFGLVWGCELRSPMQR